MIIKKDKSNRSNRECLTSVKANWIIVEYYIQSTAIIMTVVNTWRSVASLATVVRRIGLARLPGQLFLREPVQLITSSTEQNGDRKAVANGESSAEIPFILTSTGSEAPARPAILEARERIQHLNPSSPYPRLDRNAAIVTSQRRLGSEATPAG